MAEMTKLETANVNEKGTRKIQQFPKETFTLQEIVSVSRSQDSQISRRFLSRTNFCCSDFFSFLALLLHLRTCLVNFALSSLWKVLIFADFFLRSTFRFCSKSGSYLVVVSSGSFALVTFFLQPLKFSISNFWPFSEFIKVSDGMTVNFQPPLHLGFSLFLDFRSNKITLEFQPKYVERAITRGVPTGNFRKYIFIHLMNLGFSN